VLAIPISQLVALHSCLLSPPDGDESEEQPVVHQHPPVGGLGAGARGLGTPRPSPMDSAMGGSAPLAEVTQQSAPCAEGYRRGRAVARTQSHEPEAERRSALRSARTMSHTIRP